MESEEITLEDIRKDLERLNRNIEQNSAINLVFSAGVFAFAAVQIIEIVKPEMISSMNGLVWAALGFMALGLFAILSQKAL